MTRARPRLTAPASLRETARFSVLIADEDDEFRDLVRRHLGAAALVVGDVGDGDAAVRLAKRLRPDIVLIESAMALGAMEAALRIKNDRAETKVVLLTSGDDPPTVHLDGLVKKEKVRKSVMAEARRVRARRRRFRR